jgi:hypothetical protein
MRRTTDVAVGTAARAYLSDARRHRSARNSLGYQPGKSTYADTQ